MNEIAFAGADELADFPEGDWNNSQSIPAEVSSHRCRRHAKKPEDPIGSIFRQSLVRSVLAAVHLSPD
jgi:hypothetical protein